MPRLPRIDFPGLFHHVIARGIERRRIFRSLYDYKNFMARMGGILEETQTLCYAWVLMPNHIHLLLQAAMTPISRVMQRLLTGYAVSFNLRYKRVGHLFQNRYKDILCQEDPYFLELVRYIGLNPARAGIVQTPAQLAAYPWTSHSALMGNILRPWQMTDPVLQRFGSSVAEARPAYERFVVEAWHQKKQDRLEGGGLIRSFGGVSGAMQAIRSGEAYAHDVRILGDSDFVEQTLRRADQYEEEAQSLKSIPLEMIINEVSDLTGEDPLQLTEKGQRRSLTAAKAMAVYGGVTWLNQSASQMGRLLGLSGSAASRAFERGRLLSAQLQLAERLKAQSCSYVP